MKLALAVLVAASMAAAIEDVTEQEVMICGEHLIKALQEACERNSVEYLLKHGQYIPDNLDKRHEYHVHHNDRDHDHGHDHSHNHRHDINYDNHNHAQKRDDNSISEECCHKPCLVKDFISFCG